MATFQWPFCPWMAFTALNTMPMMLHDVKKWKGKWQTWAQRLIKYISWSYIHCNEMYRANASSRKWPPKGSTPTAGGATMSCEKVRATDEYVQIFTIDGFPTASVSMCGRWCYLLLTWKEPSLVEPSIWGTEYHTVWWDGNSSKSLLMSLSEIGRASCRERV